MLNQQDIERICQASHDDPFSVLVLIECLMGGFLYAPSCQMRSKSL